MKKDDGIEATNYFILQTPEGFEFLWKEEIYCGLSAYYVFDKTWMCWIHVHALDCQDITYAADLVCEIDEEAAQEWIKEKTK